MALFLPAFLFAQNADNPLRIEYKSSKKAMEHHTTLLGENGFAVSYPVGDSGPDSLTWAIVVHDTVLKVTEVKQLNIPAVSEFIDSYSEGTKLHLLFDIHRFKGEKPSWLLLTYDVKNNQHSFHRVPAAFKEVKDFKVQEQFLVITTVEKEGEDFIIYDTKREKIHFILSQNCNASEASIEFMEFDPRGKNLLVGLYLLVDANLKTYQTLNILDVSLVSDEYEYTNFPSSETISFLSARYLQISDDSFMLLGSVNASEDAKDKVRSGRKQHSGYYNMVVHAEQEVGGNKIKMEFTNPQMEGFPSVKKDKKGLQNRIVNAMADFRLMVGDAFYNNGRYSVSFEVYYPVYTQNTSYGGGGGMYTTTTPDGYMYQQAIIVTYDSTGTRVSEALFPFEDVKTKHLKPYANVYTDSDQQDVLFYAHDEKIVFSVVKESEEIEPWSEQDIILLYESDEFGRYSIVEMEHWYGNNFILFGYQQVKNKEMKESKRNIYFISKIAYE